MNPLYHGAMLLTVSVALLHAAEPVRAQTLDMPGAAPGMATTDPSNPASSRNPQIQAGLGVGNFPSYLGSDERRTRVLPAVSATWRNGWFAGTGGIGYRFKPLPSLSTGFALTLDPGRDADDASALAGTGDIAARPELGVFANYALLPGWVAHGSLRYGSGNERDGLVSEWGVRRFWPVRSDLSLFAGVSATLVNRAAMQSQFGIDQAQAATSGYAVYEPGGGLRDVQAQLGARLPFGTRGAFSLAVQSRTLFGDARESPLARQRTGVGALATMSFRL
jgi:MipA family protein